MYQCVGIILKYKMSTINVTETTVVATETRNVFSNLKP